MIFRRLKLVNFGIYAGEQTINFTTSSDGRPITLIGGINGRGKTTILDAIFLILYGNHAPHVHESGMSYSNYLKNCCNSSDPEAETSVELEFDIFASGETLRLKVRRAWHGNKNRVSDKLLVWRNSLIDYHLADNWSSYIEEILPSGIANLFFFDGEKISRLAADEETSEIMERSIKSLLGVDIVERLVRDMTRLVKRKEEQLGDLHNDNLSSIKAQLSELEIELQTKRQFQAEIRTKKERMVHNLKKNESSFLAQGGTLATSRNSLLEDKDRLKDQLAEKKLHLINIACGRLPLLLVPNLLSEIFQSSKQNEETKAARYIYPYLRQLTQDLTATLSDLELPEYIQSRIEDVALQRLSELECNDQQRSGFELSSEGIRTIGSLVDKPVQQDITNATKGLLIEITDLETRLEHIDRYLMVDVVPDSTNKILAAIKELSIKINKIDVELNHLSEEINAVARKKAQIEGMLTKEMQKLLENENKTFDSTRIISYALRTQEVMREFRQRLLDEKVIKLADKIKECFDFITHKECLFSRIEINPKTLKLTLYDSDNKVLLKSRLSAGERQMLAISILWALTQLSGRTLPIIVDSPVGRLDSSHRINFVSRYLPNASHQVIVLSTDEEIKGPYLELLDDYICNKYLLVYDEQTRATSIVEGYFQGKVS